MKNWLEKILNIGYGDALHYDSGGSSGTAHPIGTVTNPCNNLADIRTMATALNIKKIMVHNSLTLDAAMLGYHFIGTGSLIDEAHFLDFNNKDVEACMFENLALKGQIGGANADPSTLYHKCGFLGITDFRGWALNCIGLGYTISIKSGASPEFWGLDAMWGGIVISCGTPGEVRIYGLRMSELGLTDLTSGLVEISGESDAFIRINVSCNGGTIKVFGTLRVKDSSGGATVTIHGRGQDSVPINVNAINASETDALLLTDDTNFKVESCRLKCADPGANTVTVRLKEKINDSVVEVASFDITNANFATYHTLMDMFGVPCLSGTYLKITVQADAGGPYAVTGQYSYSEH